MKKLLLNGLFLSSNFAYSQTCINFQDTTLQDTGTQTTYGTPFYSNNGIDFRCKFVQYTDIMSTPMPGVDINSSSSWNPYNSNFSGHLLWMGDNNVQVDFAGLSYINKKITFDISYDANPSESNAFNVNGTGLNNLPAGVVYNYTALSAGIQVQITGPIVTLEIHGFETAIDNLCLEQIVSTTIHEPISSNAFTVFPNPIQNSVYVSSENKIDKIVLVTILGSVEQEIVKPLTNTLDVSNLKAGVYFIQVYFDQQVISKKIIKQDF